MEWINVKDKLPSEDGTYLICEKTIFGTFISVAEYTLNYTGFEPHLNGRAMWFNCGDDYCDYEVTNVTHWMSLPEKPKEDN